MRQIGIAMKRLLDGVHMTASAVVAPLIESGVSEDA